MPKGLNFITMQMVKISVHIFALETFAIVQRFFFKLINHQANAKAHNFSYLVSLNVTCTFAVAKMTKLKTNCVAHCH